MGPLPGALADLADERRQQLGAEVAGNPPQWAVESLGSVPADVVNRQEWEYRAASWPRTGTWPAYRRGAAAHVTFGDCHVSDVTFVAAFDVHAKKVGMDLVEAIVASENNTIKLCDVPPTGVTVQRSPTFDGLAWRRSGGRSTSGRAGTQRGVRWPGRRPTGRRPS